MMLRAALTKEVLVRIAFTFNVTGLGLSTSDESHDAACERKSERR